MESNMKGFKFYEKHCGRTISAFILGFLCLILLCYNQRLGGEKEYEHSRVISKSDEIRKLKQEKKQLEWEVSMLKVTLQENMK